MCVVFMCLCKNILLPLYPIIIIIIIIILTIFVYFMTMKNAENPTKNAENPTKNKEKSQAKVCDFFTQNYRN